jgi:hypothetical protein
MERDARTRTAEAADRWRAGSDSEVDARVAECMRRAERYRQLAEASADFLRAADGRLWCSAMLSFFDQSRKIGGGEARIAQARQAIEVMNSRLTLDSAAFNVPAHTYQALVRSYWQRILAQGMRFNETGDPEVIERNYLQCFDWANQPAMPAIFSDSNKAARPFTSIGGYAVESHFVYNLWCAAVLQAMQRRDLIGRAGWDEARAHQVVGYALGKSRLSYPNYGIPEAHFEMISDMVAEEADVQVARFAQSGDEAVFDYDALACFTIDYEERR